MHFSFSAGQHQISYNDEPNQSSFHCIIKERHCYRIPFRITTNHYKFLLELLCKQGIGCPFETDVQA